MRSSKSKGWLYHFSRRDRAAKEGRHLPSVSELLAGMAFLNDSLTEDAKTWAERLLMRLHKYSGNLLYEDVVVALKRLTVTPDTADFRNFIDVLQGKKFPLQIVPKEENWELRCTLYCAAAGGREAAIRLVGEVSDRLIHDVMNQDEFKAGLEFMLGLSMCLDSTSHDYVELTSPTRLRKKGSTLTRKIDISKGKFDHPDDSTRPTTMPVTNEPTGPGLIVVPALGNESFMDSDRLEKIQPMIGKKIPLVVVPDLKSIREKLLREFPYAASVVETVLRHLSSKDYISLRPTILAGPPGCGKSTFLMRMAELLGLPAEVYGCAGITDSSFGGTPRRWSTGEPAMPVSLIMNSGFANPVVILDEIEKASQSRHNGSIIDTLLSMVEPRTAVKFYDLYFQSSVNLTGVIFFGTSNEPSLLPKPVRDRFRILSFPVPQAKDLPALVPGLLADIARVRGVDGRWIEKLSGEEMDALTAAWPGGSIRSLQRLLEGVLAARENYAVIH